MANEKHIEWFKEGAAAWNQRRELDDFTPDLSGFIRDPFGGDNGFQFLSKFKWWDENRGSNYDLRGANLDGARLSWFEFVGADFSGASLREANLHDTVFYEANFKGADLTGAKLQSTQFLSCDIRKAQFDGAVFSAGSRYSGTNARGVDLSRTKGLDRRFYSSMEGDDNTHLPSRLPAPPEWTSASDVGAKMPTLPATPIAHTIEIEDGNMSLGRARNELDEQTLSGLFEDLKDAVEDIRDLGNLDNHAPLLVKGIGRFLTRMPKRIEELDQVRFGTNAQALSIQYNRERALLEELAPEKIGHLDAALLRASLISANLPVWQAFREAEASSEPVFEAKREDIEAILEHAADALEDDPEHFDPSLFERVREYLDDSTIVAYLAAKDLLLGIAHKTFTLTRDLTIDSVGEARKVAIKGIASALLAQLGTTLANLVGLLPRELFWLSDWLRYLPTILS